MLTNTRQKAKTVVNEKANGTLVLTPADTLTVPASKVDINPIEWAFINPTKLSLSDYAIPTSQFVDKVAAKLMVKPGGGFARIMTPWLKKAPSSENTLANYVNARLFTTLVQRALIDKWPHYFKGLAHHDGQLIKDRSIAGLTGKNSSKSPHFDQFGLITSVGIVHGPNQGITGGNTVIVDAAALRQNHGLTQGHIGWALNQNAQDYYSAPPTGDMAHFTKDDVRQLIKKHTLVMWDSKHPQLKKPCIVPIFTNNRGLDTDFATGTMGRMHGATPVTALNPEAVRQFFRVLGGVRTQ